MKMLILIVSRNNHEVNNNPLALALAFPRMSTRITSSYRCRFVTTNFARNWQLYLVRGSSLRHYFGADQFSMWHHQRACVTCSGTSVHQLERVRSRHVQWNLSFRLNPFFFCYFSSVTLFTLFTLFSVYASCSTWTIVDCKTVVFGRFRKARSAKSAILACEAREPHTPVTQGHTILEQIKSSTK